MKHCKNGFANLPFSGRLYPPLNREKAPGAQRGAPCLSYYEQKISSHFFASFFCLFLLQVIHKTDIMAQLAVTSVFCPASQRIFCIAA